MATVEIILPRLHSGQKQVYDNAERFNVLMCGRRFGKTTFGQWLAVDAILKGKHVGWFSPTYKYSAEVWRDLKVLLRPILTTDNRIEGRMETLTGGSLEVWSLDNKDAGRGRKYSKVIIDEAGVVKDLDEIWQQALRPTLTDFKGDAWFLGTPKGRGFFQRLFAQGQDGKREGWKSWRLPTLANPHMPPEEVAEARRELPPEIFAQEYEGVPADDGGCPFNLKAIAECIAPMKPTDPVMWGVDLAKSQDFTVACALDEEGCICRLERWQGDWSLTSVKLANMIGESMAIIDSTGVGDPVVETLQSKCPLAEGFKFTQHSKQQIMEGLAVGIQTTKVRFPDGWLRSELEMFEYEYTRTGVRYEAPSGCFDDGVCALALAWHGYTNRLRTAFSYRVI
tara:strand:- start:3607 stop:4791 length:1185 start_codon:yes stop_codon:yes gene_type:complete